MFKQVIVIRNDIKLKKSETVKIVAWASIFSAQKCKNNFPKKFTQWLKTGQKKVVLKTLNLSQLVNLKNNLEKNKKLVFHEVEIPKDFSNKLESREFIAIGIGPDKEKILDALTNMYKLL
ncbi:MAG: Peptidyl-tRNA hydrolase [Candidatus Heimdallarchaeota archaeon LC_3]|nr:MAG: Peptidyl-tRNA hydrolase [Candidatus Heimdallarchaeota archaeon LC_3]